MVTTQLFEKWMAERGTSLFPTYRSTHPHAVGVIALRLPAADDRVISAL